jgi:hypothetical protein
MPKPERERIAIIVEFQDDPAAKDRGERFTRSNAYRLKMVLKIMLRSFGMKCLKVRNDTPESERIASEAFSANRASESTVERHRHIDAN